MGVEGAGGGGGAERETYSDLYYTRIKIFSNWLFLPQLSALANLSFTQCREIRRGERWGERRERGRDLK